MALLRKRSKLWTPVGVSLRGLEQRDDIVRAPVGGRSASTKAKSATIAVARRSCRARRSGTSLALHLIIRTGEFALAVAVREADGT